MRRPFVKQGRSSRGNVLKQAGSVRAVCQPRVCRQPERHQFFNVSPCSKCYYIYLPIDIPNLRYKSAFYPQDLIKLPYQGPRHGSTILLSSNTAKRPGVNMTFGYVLTKDYSQGSRGCVDRQIETMFKLVIRPSYLIAMAVLVSLTSCPVVNEGINHIM